VKTPDPKNSPTLLQCAPFFIGMGAVLIGMSYLFSWMEKQQGQTKGKEL